MQRSEMILCSEEASSATVCANTFIELVEMDKQLTNTNGIMASASSATVCANTFIELVETRQCLKV